MNETKIEWTDYSSNPLRYRDKRTGKTVWGCIKVSPGCANCYAEATAERFERGGPFTRATMEHLEPFLDEQELRKLLTSKKLSGKRVFVGDMTDVFGEWVPDEMLDRLFAVFALRPDVCFQVLTKRAKRMRGYMDSCFTTDSFCGPVNGWKGKGNSSDRIDGHIAGLVGVAPWKLRERWPLPNVWLGVSVEDQQRADERIPDLLATPAAVRFLSCEPLLGEVDLHQIQGDSACDCMVPAMEGAGQHSPSCSVFKFPAGIHWVIAGGESGKSARPCRVEWIRSLVQQCKVAGTAVFVKQLGANVLAGNILDPIDQFPNDAVPDFTQGPDRDTAAIQLRDRKGSDTDEWPADLRVREMPT